VRPRLLALRAAGLCIDDCGRNASPLPIKRVGPPSPRCAPCRLAMAARINGLRKARRAKGLCSGPCGKPSKTSRCPDCTPRVEPSAAAMCRELKARRTARKKARKKGLCYQCREPSKKPRCAECSKVASDKAKAQRAERIAEGVCIVCGTRPFLLGRLKCARCVKSRRERQKRRRAKTRAARAPTA
jgi:hypothetical protein